MFVFVYASVLKVTLVYQSIVVSQVTGRVKLDMKRSEGYTLLSYGRILKKSAHPDSSISVTNVLLDQNMLKSSTVVSFHIKEQHVD